MAKGFEADSVFILVGYSSNLLVTTISIKSRWVRFRAVSGLFVLEILALERREMFP